MAAGLNKSLVPVFVGGALDKKVDPRLMPAGSLLELENCWQLRTGELRLRNGFSVLSATRNIASAQSLFAGPRGELNTISKNGGGFTPWANYVKYGASPTGDSGWESVNGGQTRAYPIARARISGITGMPQSGAATDLSDGDVAISGGMRATSHYDSASVQGQVVVVVSDNTTGKITLRNSMTSSVRPGIIVDSAAGADSFLVFFGDSAAPPNLKVALVQTSTIYTTLALNGLSAAQPWIDAKKIPGGNLVAVAYRANVGGVSFLVFDSSTQLVTVGPVNVAGADASMCLGWLEDSLSTGNVYLATAGSGSGVVVRTLNPATMAVTVTNVIDATATVGVRNITGHIDTSATAYTVLWDVAGTSSIYDKVQSGIWTGAATVGTLLPTFSLCSRTFKMADGQYYFLGAYDSQVSPVYGIFQAKSFIPNGKTAAPIAMVLNGDAGGRRSQCSLTSVPANGTSFLATVARKRRVATPGVASTQAKLVQVVTISDDIGKFARPRELGGTFFVPGGVLHRDDGNGTEYAVFPVPPESVACVSAGGGSMTPSGAYGYRVVWKYVDATGRIQRSAPSVPTLVTLGAGDSQVTVTIQNQRILMSELATRMNAELYRAGPAATGATGYNRVAEVVVPQTTAVDTFVVVDTMSDVNAALGETLYTTGNTLDNFAPPASSILEVNGNRIGIVNAEDPTEFWFSGEYKDGVGAKFNPLLKIRISGDGYGDITALAAMDGRWILFKSSAIYAISGNGPNDLGQGEFNAPQAASLSIGTLLPGSVVATPDGIMFQSQKGIYLLDRGLGLTYVGAPVEQYTLAANVVDASLVTGATTVRFVFASGRMLEYDYFHKRWYTHQLRVDRSGSNSTVVACANSSQLGWCYALANGDVMQETPGVFSDINGTTTAIVPRIGFPNLNLAGITGFQRVYGIQIEGEFVGNHTLQVISVFDLGASTEPTRSLAITAGPYSYQVLNATQKCMSIQPTITCSLAAGSGAFRLSGISLLVGIKKGTGIPFTKRAS